MKRRILKLTTIMIALFLLAVTAGCNFPMEDDEGTSEAGASETLQEDNACSSEPQNEKCYDSAYDMDADCYMMDMAADSVCGYTLKNDYSQVEFEKWLEEYPWDCDDNNPEIWTGCLVPYMGESGQGCEALYQQVHAEGYDTFIPFGDSFDLDQGTITGGLDPASDFTVHPGPGGEGSTIEFIPAPPASFAFSGVFLFQPSLDQCESSSTLSSGTEVIAILDYYVPYKTNQGRYGYIYFKDYDAVSGITIDWRTFEAAQCYDSAYDMDGDCHMTDMAADSVCGYSLKNDYGQDVFDAWLEEYPWDCDDSDPSIWVDCPVLEDMSMSTPTNTVKLNPTATEPPPARPTATELPPRPTLTVEPTATAR